MPEFPHSKVTKPIIFFHSSRQDELEIVQREERQQAVAQYDLGLRPKLKESDKLKSLPMPDVQAVRPVESGGSSGKAIRVKAFDSPKVPIKMKAAAQINEIRRIEDIASWSRFQKLDVKGNGRKKVRPAESTIIAQLITINFIFSRWSIPSARTYSGRLKWLLTRSA